MEKLLRVQRMELLRQGAPDSDDEDWDSPQWPEERVDLADVKEDDSLEDTDLAFITSILDSFSQPKSKAEKHNTRNRSTESFCTIFPPEGALTPTDAEPWATPPEFNYNSMIKNTTAKKVSCLPTAEEERTDKFLKVSEKQDQTGTDAVLRKTRTTLLQHGNRSSPSCKNLFTKTRLLSLGGKSPLHRHVHFRSLPSKRSCW